MERRLPVLSDMTPEQRQNLVCDDKFPPGAHWVLMDADDDIVDESDMVVEGREFVGPTEDAPAGDDGDENEEEGEGEVGGNDGTARANRIEKRNYSKYTFDRPPFFRQQTLLPERIEGSNRLKRTRRGRNGKESFSYSKTFNSHHETVPNFEFLFKHEIGLDSHPAEWFAPWLPFHRKPDMDPKIVTIQDLTTWSNTKAILSNAGTGGGSYKDFRQFTMNEVRAHLGLYALHGLSPSPQIEMKFRSQEEDPVNGSDLCHRVFGINGVTRAKEFKAFFASVNPLIAAPPRSRSPNHKVDPMLHHLMMISKEAVVVGKNISVDEMDISFQGQHSDKQRISYKHAGDGFLVDVLCADGYCYSFYFRNQSPPAKWTSQDLSPLHARVLALFEQLPQNSRNYACKMDNLFMSAKFARICLTSVHSKVMIHGVTRLNKRGIPKCVEQKKETRKQDILNARGKLKVARLEGDPKCKLVAACLHDVKPVYLLSTSCEKVE